MTPTRTLLGLLLLAGAAAAQDSDLSWVDKRVGDWQPRPSERKMDQIGWAADIRSGLALAKKHNRPLYLFTLDGRMARNRCGAGGCGLREDALSNDTIISLLNAHFVPVYVDNADYSGNGAAPADERQAFSKIYTTAANKNLNIGSVRVYVCAPDGDPILIAGGGAQKDIELLQGVVKKFGTPAGKPVVPPRPQNPAPKVEKDALLLHLTVRGMPLGARVFWSNLPAEDWISYARAEWMKFLPPAGAAVGKSWDVDREVATKLLCSFYPPEDECLMYEWGRVRKIEYENVSMKATLVARDQVRLDASLRMKECFANNHFGFNVDAKAVGVVDLDPAKKAIKRFVLATEKATNGGSIPFGVAVRSEVAP